MANGSGRFAEQIVAQNSDSETWHPGFVLIGSRVLALPDNPAEPAQSILILVISGARSSIRRRIRYQFFWQDEAVASLKKNFETGFTL